jgi:D-alanyl-D-alanine carboxypeptidase
MGGWILQAMPQARRTRSILGLAMIMQRHRLPLLIALLFVSTTLVARADKTDDYVKARMAEFHLPGLSVVVIKDGKIVKSAGYGFADVAKKVPATPDTVYKIGSVSKQFIATGIMLLAADGRLGIDDLASKYIAGTPPTWKAITIRHMLTHTAGLVRESPAFDPNKVQSDADVIEAAYPVKLRFTPGEKWEYSNVGYFALADIIRIVSKQPWSAFLLEQVFKPTGMTTTAPTNIKPIFPLMAVGNTGNDNSSIASDWVALRPSGAFLSTVLDMAKWDAMLYTDRVLSAAVRQQMWTPVRLNDGTSHPYGFGWHVDSGKSGKRIWHGGGLPGFVSHYVRFLDHGLSVVVLTNADDVDLPSIANGIAALYLPTSKPR